MATILRASRLRSSSSFRLHPSLLLFLPCVCFHRDRGGHLLAVNRDLHQIGSGVDWSWEPEAASSATTAAARSRCAGWTWRRIGAQVPLHAVPSRFFGPGDA